MSVLTEKSAEHESYWALRLLTLLQQMAAQNTNAALTVLENVDHLESQCRYPDAGLLFAGKRWRAFYHCHEAASMHSNEHGHFHIFTDIGKQSWAHVAGLSIDTEGQPLQWFMVNRWVTDGPWLESEDFLNQLKYAEENHEDDGLVGSWLVILLRLYQNTLSELFMKRDEQIQHKLEGRSKAETLENRDIYILATRSIDLQSMLEKYLLHSHAGVSTGAPKAVHSNENTGQGI